MSGRDILTAHCLLPSAYFSIRDRGRNSGRNPCASLRASDERASNGRAVPVVVGNPRLSENDQPRGPTTRGRGTPGERAPGHLYRFRWRPPAYEQRARRRSRHSRRDHAARATLGRPIRPRRPGFRVGRGLGRDRSRGRGRCTGMVTSGLFMRHG